MGKSPSKRAALLLLGTAVLGIAVLLFVINARQPVVRETRNVLACGYSFEIADGYTAFEYGKRPRNFGGGPNSWHWHIRSDEIDGPAPEQLDELFDQIPAIFATPEAKDRYAEWSFGYNNPSLRSPKDSEDPWLPNPRLAGPERPTEDCVVALDATRGLTDPKPRETEWAVEIFVIGPDPELQKRVEQIQEDFADFIDE